MSLRARIVGLLLTAAVLAPAVLALPPPAEAACPSDARVGAFLADFHALRPTKSFGTGLSLADGLCAQGKLVAALRGELGPPIGYKVGLTNKAVQERFNVPHPVRGVLLERMLLRSGATVPAGYAAIPLYEADLLVRIKDGGIAETSSDRDVLARIDQVIPFIELPDLTFAPGEHLDGANLTAVNVAARLGVAGTPIPVEASDAFAGRLAAMTVVMVDDTGKELARSPGSAILGHPLHVVRWLAADLARAGAALRPGDLVSLGSYSRLLPAREAVGRTITVRYEGLVDPVPTVSVTLR